MDKLANVPRCEQNSENDRRRQPTAAAPVDTGRHQQRKARAVGRARAIRRRSHVIILQRTTVYRSMHLLESIGMVKRFEFGDGVARFELLKEGDSGHHHHLVCTRCSGVVEIEECIIEALEAKLAERNGYKAVTHKLEFFGICPECQ